MTTGTPAKLLAVHRVGAVRLVRLEAPGYVFRAGQYTTVLHPSGVGIPFSVASSPDCLPELELHFLAQPDHPDATRMEALLHGPELVLLPAAGTVVADAGNLRPVLYAAGGTGITQALSMAAWSVRHRPDLVQHIVWGVREDTDLYCRDTLDALAAHDHVSVHTVVEANGGGTVADAVLRTMERLDGWRVVLCGGPPMVHATLDALAPRGAAPDNTEADVFSYAPRA